MKRFVCALLLVVLTVACCACAKNDKPVSEHDAMVKEAVEVLKKYWAEEIYSDENHYKPGDGYLQIVNTRVIDIKDELEAENGASVFENVDYVIEFIMYANMYYSAPIYMATDGYYSFVMVYKDGSIEISHIGDPFDAYRARYYSSDFSHIIEEVIDLGDAYDGTYILK